MRGKSIDNIFSNIDRLMAFDPAYINITTHRTEVVYQPMDNGMYRCFSEIKRPGTVAIAAALKGRFGIPTVPHIICGGYSRHEIEDELIDLSYLGINDILVLRGDRQKGENRFSAATDGHSHADGLCRQVNDFNAGRMVDGTETTPLTTPFTYGVAGYPEKHEEAMNPETDMEHLKRKVEMGAQYIVTQMFFDNEKYYAFVDRCRAEGITVPIIPGIKPIVFKNQLTVLPKIFRSDIPEPFATELRKCKTDDEAKAVGVEWCIQQCKDLIAHGVPSLHFYTMMASDSVYKVAKEVY